MRLESIIYVEDNTEKYMELFRFLKKQGVKEIEWAKNAEQVIEKIKAAETEENQYDLLLSDMHFDFFGTNDMEAGQKVLSELRTAGIDIPVVFCSSQNWKIPGSLGNIFYNPRRNWEFEAEALFRDLKRK